MKRTALVLIVVLLATSAVVVAQSASQPANIGALDRYLGAWQSSAVINPCVWVPSGEQQHTIVQVSLFLNRKFLQMVSLSEHQESLSLLRYDSQKDIYQMWTYDSNGNTGYWTGVWDKTAQTMTWKYALTSIVGITGVIVDRFTSADAYNTVMIMTDSRGNLLLDVQSESVRKKPFHG